MTEKEIIAQLPYKAPFLFVEELLKINSDGIKGTYTFPANAFFYQGHFKNNPVTPGVILTETMAQIGVVCLGIYLNSKIENKEIVCNNSKIALTSNVIDFFIPVYPNEKVTVVSEKVYYRFQKLKCKVKMFNSKNELVCQGVISGMLYEEK